MKRGALGLVLRLSDLIWRAHVKRSACWTPTGHSPAHTQSRTAHLPPVRPLRAFAHWDVSIPFHEDWDMNSGLQLWLQSPPEARLVSLTFPTCCHRHATRGLKLPPRGIYSIRGIGPGPPAVVPNPVVQTRKQGQRQSGFPQCHTANTWQKCDLGRLLYFRAELGYTEQWTPVCQGNCNVLCIHWLEWVWPNTIWHVWLRIR